MRQQHVWDVKSKLTNSSDDQLSPNRYESLFRCSKVSQSEFFLVLSIFLDVHIMVHMKRDLQSIHIISYNPVVSKAFHSNLDKTHVFDAYACFFYLVFCFGKRETSVSDTMKTSLKQMRAVETNWRQTMQSIGVAFLNACEFSIQESVYRSLLMLWLLRLASEIVF